MTPLTGLKTLCIQRTQTFSISTIDSSNAENTLVDLQANVPVGIDTWLHSC